MSRITRPWKEWKRCSQVPGKSSLILRKYTNILPPYWPMPLPHYSYPLSVTPELPGVEKLICEQTSLFPIFWPLNTKPFFLPDTHLSDIGFSDGWASEPGFSNTRKFREKGNVRKSWGREGVFLKGASVRSGRKRKSCGEYSWLSEV